MHRLENNGLPVWLVIFPEGTRYNPINNKDAIERSRLFAQRKGWQTKLDFIRKYIFDCLGILPFDYVLSPRSGATVAAIKVLKEKLDAVYDVTVMYNQTYDDDRRSLLAAPSMAGKELIMRKFLNKYFS